MGVAHTLLVCLYISALYLVTALNSENVDKNEIRAALQCGTNPRTCYNGGYLAKDSCVCPAFTSGSCCETIQCQNDGIQTGNYCKCPPGWYSRFCEKRGSRPKIQSALDFTKRSLVVLFNSVETMQTVRNSVGDMLQKALNSLDTLQPNSIENYFFLEYITVSVGNSFNTPTAKFLTTNRTDFIQLIKTESLSTSSPTNEQQETMRMIFETQGYSQNPSAKDQTRYQFINPKSTILVFTDRADIAGTYPTYQLFGDNPTLEERTIKRSLFWRNRPIIFFYNTSTTPVDQSSMGMASLRRFVTGTNGELLQTSVDETDQVAQMIPYMVKNEFYQVVSMDNCEDLTFGTNLSGNDKNAQQYMLITKWATNGDNSTIVATEQPDSMTGGFPLQVAGGANWKLFQLAEGAVEHVKTSAVCSVKIFIQSDVSLLYSMSDAVLADADTVIRYNGQTQYIVAQYIPVKDSMTVYQAGVRFQDAYTGLSLESYNGNPTTNDSSFQILFDPMGTCRNMGPMTIRFNLQIANGNILTRVYPGFCSIAPTATPTPSVVALPPKIIEVDTSCLARDLSGFNQPRFHDYEQIIFVVELTTQMQDALSGLMKVVPDVISQISSNATQPQYFSLITFSDQTIMNIASEYAPGNFIDIFKKTLSNSSLPTRNGDGAYVLPAMLEGIRMQILSAAQINVFTASKSAQTGANSWMMPRDVEINFYVISNDVDVESAKRVVQKQTGGRLISLPSTSVVDMKNLLTYAVKENALLHDTGAQDCSNPMKATFYVDTSVSTVTLTLYGKDIQAPQLTDNNNQSIPYSSLFTSPNSAVYVIDAVQTMQFGPVWTATVGTKGANQCYFQARAVTSFNVALGFMSNNFSDSVDSMPFSRSGTNNLTYTVAQSTRNDFKQLQILVVTGDFNTPWQSVVTETLLMSARSPACTYQWISQNYQMPAANGIKMIVNGEFSDGTPFQRMFFYYTPINPNMCPGNQHNSYGQCVCDGYHQGEFCQYPVCANGGTSGLDVCICPLGYYGDYCTYGNGALPNNTTPATIPTGTSPTPMTSSPTSTGARFLSIFLIVSLLGSWLVLV